MPKGDWLLTGGFPCQDLSSAGKGRGLDGERSGLFYEYIRLIGEIRPRIAVMENVPRLLGWFDESPTGQKENNKNIEWESDQYQGIARCGGHLSQIGYDTEWQVISASALGASHKRERVWIIAYPTGERFKEAQFQERKLNKKLQEMRGKGLNENLAGIICNKNKQIPVKYFLREDDGISGELDAIKGAGNAIVPQCAELIFSLSAFDKWRM